MHDDFHAAVRADQDKQFSAMIHKVFSKVATVFVYLNALQFDAPWQHEAKRRDCR